MSLRPGYARESRSSYARSASSDGLVQHRSSSSAVVEREVSYPSLVWDCLDDPFFFQRRGRLFYDDFGRRLRLRLCDDLLDREFFRPTPLDFERNLAISYRDYTDSVLARPLPIVYTPPSSLTVYREKIDKTNDWSSNSIQRQEETFKTQTGDRFAADEWSLKQEPPTRKRTSMTIFVRPPHIQYSDAPQFQRTTSIRDYSSKRRNFF